MMLKSVLVRIVVGLIVSNVCIQGSTTNLPFCHNSTDFASIVNCPAFVDKTLLIKRIFDSNKKIYMITAPQGFGKSTNINMIKRFVEIVSDKNGIPKDKNKTENYKLFKTNVLKISTDDNLFHERFGKYPVIYLDYKPFRYVNNFIEMFITYRSLLIAQYLQHKYLLESETLSWNDKDEILKHINFGLSEVFLLHHVMSGFHTLSRLLYKHFNKKIMILIDEFDAHFDSMLFGNGTDIREMVPFIHNVEKQLLQDNEYLSRAVLSGVFRMNYFPLQKKPSHYRWLDNNPFSIYYGITKSEVDELLTKFVTNNEDQEKAKSKSKFYYNGFISLNRNTTIYSYSFIDYLLHESELSDLYYTRYEYLKNILPVFGLAEIRGKLQSLILGGHLILNLSVRSIVPIYILALKNFVSFQNVSVEQTNLFFYFLHENGYISASSDSVSKSPLTESSYSKASKVKIPNHETKLLFIQLLKEVYINQMNVSQDDIDSVNSMVNSFSEHTMNDSLFKHLCEALNCLIGHSVFKVQNKNDLLSLLSVLLKPTFISNENEVRNAKFQERDHTSVLLTNDHGISFIMGTEIVHSKSQTLRENAAISVHETLINKHCIDRNYQNKVVYLGLSYDYSRTISIAYSYLVKKGDDLNKISILP